MLSVDDHLKNISKVKLLAAAALPTLLSIIQFLAGLIVYAHQDKKPSPTMLTKLEQLPALR